MTLIWGFVGLLGSFRTVSAVWFLIFFLVAPCYDTLAIDALRAVADLGLSARDVSVVGYDDIPVAGHPLVSLTTVTQFGEAIGRAAVDLLMERIRGGRTAPWHRVLQPELRVRSSSQRGRSTEYA